MGEVHAEKVAPSREHSNVAPASEEKVNVAVSSLVGPEGPECMVVWGAVVSTVQVLKAGVVAVLPVASVALTWKVCDPSERLA